MDTTDSDTQQWPLGPKLRDARKSAGLSQREAAQAAGFSPTTWGQLESGTKKLGQGVEVAMRPRPSVVQAAAQVVGLDVAEALRMAGHEPGNRDQPPPSAPTVSQRRLVDVFASLTQRQRHAVMEIVESMNDPHGQTGQAGELPQVPPFGEHQVFMDDAEENAGTSQQRRR